MANFNIRQTSLIRQEDKILIPLPCPKVMRLEKVRRSVVLLAEILVELLAGTLHEGLKTFSLSSIAHCVSHFLPLISFMTVLLEEYTKISKREPRLLCSCWTQKDITFNLLFCFVYALSFMHMNTQAARTENRPLPSKSTAS